MFAQACLASSSVCSLECSCTLGSLLDKASMRFWAWCLCLLQTQASSAPSLWHRRHPGGPALEKDV